MAYSDCPDNKSLPRVINPTLLIGNVQVNISTS